ncbi:hypothetical protein [Synechococcus sp. CS-1328]|uniref:hypothetical protein n=1 Tax=Synechococcus sp. CS-1328 TaxID=2847976 RepID=UPI00223BA2CD|nr:hypothetical protein [Synechococcus sp. CS-1328]MCT0224650.1 hypothetical protein [Synechococcus sp. CS-1328]
MAPLFATTHSSAPPFHCANAPTVDLPPLQLEMVRIGLQGEPAAALCRNAPLRPDSLRSSVSGSTDCTLEPGWLRIDNPAGWPVAPPPPP